MNKKEWQKYNKKIVNKGRDESKKESTIKSAKENGSKIIMKPKYSKKLAHDRKESVKNIHALFKTVYKGISKYIKKYYGSRQLTLDFQEIMKPVHNGGSVAITLLKPTLHLNIALSYSDSKYIYTKWIKNLYVINPEFHTISNPKSKYIYSYKPLDLHTDGYLHGVFDNFMKIPNAYRQINWEDHYYFSEK